MSDERADEEVATNLSQVDEESQKTRPPSKKKYEADVEKLMKQIREKEDMLEKMKTSGGLNINDELRSLKVEKTAAITSKRQIDAELEKLKKVLPEKMCQLGQLESSLVYKNEEKINTAIQRLEWNLNVQTFKLKEEKKIVSEIDRLKRSKKTLVHYLALKQEISGIRDAQRLMREERDTYCQAVSKLNSNEDRLRRDSTSARTAVSELKHQIDELYEAKRQLVANNKKQMEEYQAGREKPRKGSWKRREDFRKSTVTDRRKQQLDFDLEKIPYEKHISWCNSLIKFLSRYNSLSMQEPCPDGLSPTSSMEDPEPAEEIDDGQFVLLKKVDEGLDHTLGTKRPSKKNRRPRKQSSIKRITLSSDMVQQITELGLKAPNSVLEVAEAIECLRAKKVILEQEQQSSEVASDAGISATESLICEMSRQASKTESCEEILETNPGEQVYNEILRKSLVEQSGSSESWAVEGTVGGAVGGCCEVQSDVLSPNSDSTVEADVNSSESQSSFSDNTESSSHDPHMTATVDSIAGNYISGKERKPVLRSEPAVANRRMDKTGESEREILPGQRKIKSPLRDETKGHQLAKDSSLLNSPRDGYIENTGQMSKQASGGPQDLSAYHSVSKEKPKSLCIPSSSNAASQQVICLTSPIDFPSLKPVDCSPGAEVVKRSICNTLSDPVRPGQNSSKVPPASSPTVPYLTLAARLSNTSPATCGAVHQALSHQPLQPPLMTHLDNDEFPSLSQSLSQAWKGSNISVKSSSGSSVHQQEQHSAQPRVRHLSNHQASNQITYPPHAQPVFPSQLSSQPPNHPMTEEPPDLQSQKCGTPHANTLISMSHIPPVDKSSTEKWVESSVAFSKEFSPVSYDDSNTATITESTKL